MLRILRLQDAISNLVAEKCNNYFQCMTVTHNKSRIKLFGGSGMDDEEHQITMAFRFFQIHLKAHNNYFLKWQY